MDKKKKVLIIHDDSSLLSALHHKCLMEGFNVLQATDGEKGLEIALREHPDIIISDILMPKKNGIELVNELRKDSWGQGANIMLLTNSTNNEYVTAALQNKVYDYLITTDWKLEDVIKRIRVRLNLPIK